MAVDANKSTAFGFNFSTINSMELGAGEAPTKNDLHPFNIAKSNMIWTGTSCCSFGKTGSY